jgi:hypothetical protein
MELPVVPTARREFAPSDRFLVFMRVYQGLARKEPLTPVQLRSVVTDTRGREVGRASHTLDAGRFQQGGPRSIPSTCRSVLCHPTSIC